MSMFPGAGAQVYYNDVGEPLGWDSTAYDEPDYSPEDEAYDGPDDDYGADDYDEGDFQEADESGPPYGKD